MTAAGQATAVIAAAGSGERLGAGQPKALVELAGRPMLAWSLAAFARARTVQGAVVAVPAGDEDSVATVAAEIGGLSTEVVPGGGSRSESVSLALARVATDTVAIHDAARPLVTPGLIDALVDRLGSSPALAGVIAVAPLADTVKRVTAGVEADGGRAIAETLDRAGLRAAQTPQVFRAEALREALEGDPGLLVEATDDASLVERAGGRVVALESPHPNPKVTTPLDLRLAELLLAG